MSKKINGLDYLKKNFKSNITEDIQITPETKEDDLNPTDILKSMGMESLAVKVEQIKSKYPSSDKLNEYLNSDDFRKNLERNIEKDMNKQFTNAKNKKSFIDTFIDTLTKKQTTKSKYLRKKKKNERRTKK